jgi:hypothetical protein
MKEPYISLDTNTGEIACQSCAVLRARLDDEKRWHAETRASWSKADKTYDTIVTDLRAEIARLKAMDGREYDRTQPQG